MDSVMVVVVVLLTVLAGYLGLAYHLEWLDSGVSLRIYRFLRRKFGCRRTAMTCLMGVSGVLYVGSFCILGSWLLALLCGCIFVALTAASWFKAAPTC